MTSTSEYRALLAKGGAARKLLGSEPWVDDFCDGLLLRLIIPAGDCKIHLWKLRDGFQVNVDNKTTGTYTHDVTDDPLKIIGERLDSKVVCGSDTV